MITFLARAFFAFVEATHRFTGNYGLDSLILIAAVRTAMLPLTFQQIRMQRGMKKVQPRLKGLEKLRKSEPQKFNEEVMKVYQEEGVNPLAGCLPLLIQLPILFALFSMLRDPAINGGVFLRESVLGMRMGTAPVALAPSLADATALPGTTATPWSFGADPSFVAFYWPGLAALVLYVGSMVLYQNLMSTGAAEGEAAAQMKMQSRLMTVFFVVLFLFFPVGLILVWLAFNLLSIAQHLHITKILDRQEALAPAAAAPESPAAAAPPPSLPTKDTGRRRRRRRRR